MTDDDGTYYNRNSETSKESAEQAKEFAGSLEQKVLTLIIESGDAGMTADELDPHFPNVKSSITPRITSLKEKGLICESGRKRLTKSKRKANVLVAAGAKIDREAVKSWRNVTTKRILRSLGENGFELTREGLFWELRIHDEYARSFNSFEEAIKELGMWIVETGVRKRKKHEA